MLDRTHFHFLTRKIYGEICIVKFAVNDDRQIQTSVYV